MVIDIYTIISILGLLFIMLGGVFSLKRKTRIKYTYVLHVIGGIFLLIYSIHIDDLIFIILQGAFILLATFELIVSRKK